MGNNMLTSLSEITASDSFIKVYNTVKECNEHFFDLPEICNMNVYDAVKVSDEIRCLVCWIHSNRGRENYEIELPIKVVRCGANIIRSKE